MDEIGNPTSPASSTTSTSVQSHEQSQIWQQLVRIFAQRRLDFNRVITTNRRKSRERLRKQMSLLRQQYFHRMVEIQNEFLLKIPLPAGHYIDSSSESDGFWEKTVPEFGPEEWLDMFRVDKVTFDWIVHQVEVAMSPAGVSAPLNKLIPLQKRVAMSLHILASGADYRQVARLFGVSRASVCKFTRKFAAAFLDKTSGFLLSMPSAGDLPEIIQNFEEKTGLPLMVGCLGCAHIPVCPPKKEFGNFVHHNSWPSILFEALVDDKLLFRKIVLKSRHKPALMTDLSELDFTSTNLLIENHKISSYVVGSPSYPLRPWIMKRYPFAHTDEEDRFNTAINKALAIKEEAFRRFFGRWHILTRKADLEPATMELIASACCALHNLIEENEIGFNDAWVLGGQAASKLKGVVEVLWDEDDCEEGASVRRGLAECLQT